ncbi:hypothetical protein K431DRAFT_285674 [Polychaeton citri CBS 116435]|uniref:Uncharacterized protein n=1 Tax=Polychaeton citri CBS 116435 TaxID=1314669 RepID=A0A9P4Q9I8_9PEZI|nr:hypothetical protein K431DRAFT_285674 [Polychaeton citri CBS 116435]
MYAAAGLPLAKCLPTAPRGALLQPCAVHTHTHTHTHAQTLTVATAGGHTLISDSPSHG